MENMKKIMYFPQNNVKKWYYLRQIATNSPDEATDML